ncbi:MAG: hypothetical protein KAI79_17050 [Bacteroidales bacterium]|nr:hypothetical protein [Bacteroidales bacterium]
MSYTIKIERLDSDLAKNLYWYLKNLTKSKEYDFLQIIEESEDATLTEEQKIELDFRYQHFMKNKEDFEDWDDLKQKYMKK